MALNRRAVLAVLFAIIYPGLGHVYLRTWFRALAWFGLAVLTAALVVPESAVAAFDSGGISALFDESARLPLDAFLALFVVRLLNVVDAYVVAVRSRRRAESGPGCPNCGGELDEDLDFCPWCTSRLD